MRKLILIFACILLFHLSWGLDYTIETIPDPKKNGGGYVSDPDQLLSPAAVGRLNSMLQELEDSTTFQAAVVVVNSIGEQVPKDFATSLFNHWGIGQADTDNGFLLLVVMGQRRMEMETGYGTETVLTDIACKRIQENFMVPLFKEGRYEEGIVDGMQQVCRALKDPSVLAELDEMSDGSNSSGDAFYMLWFISLFYYIPAAVIFFIMRKNKMFTHLHGQATGKYKNKAPIPLKRWLGLYIAAPIVFLIFVSVTEMYLIYFLLSYLLVITFFLEKRLRNNTFVKEHTSSDPYELYSANKDSHKNWGILALLIPIPFLFYYISYKVKQRSLRNVARTCKKCSHQMKKLAETADDAYLKEGQILEEKLRAVDYDVWSCDNCSSQLVQSYLNLWSKYKNCDACKYKTQYLYKRETLTAATYDSSGTGLNTYLCKHCNHRKEETYTIPKKTRSSSSGSSSSGGSWGGGSSGGGGAGSSW